MSTPRYLNAQDRLERVLEMTKTAFKLATEQANQAISYQTHSDRAAEHIGHTHVAAALATLLAVLEPEEADRWRNQANYYTNMVRTRTLGLRGEILALERDAQRGRRAMRGMPY